MPAINSTFAQSACITCRARLSPRLIVLAFCAVIAANGTAAADAEAGKRKAEACTACHGETGISQTENTPSLASQPDQFLADQRTTPQ